MSHSYLGSLSELLYSHHGNSSPSSIISSLLFLSDVVIFPGESIPLRLSDWHKPLRLHVIASLRSKDPYLIASVPGCNVGTLLEIRSQRIGSDASPPSLDSAASSDVCLIAKALYCVDLIDRYSVGLVPMVRGRVRQRESADTLSFCLSVGYDDGGLPLHPHPRFLLDSVYNSNMLCAKLLLRADQSLLLTRPTMEELMPQTRPFSSSSPLSSSSSSSSSPSYSKLSGSSSSSAIAEEAAILQAPATVEASLMEAPALLQTCEFSVYPSFEPRFLQYGSPYTPLWFRHDAKDGSSATSMATSTGNTTSSSSGGGGGGAPAPTHAISFAERGLSVSSIVREWARLRIEPDAEALSMWAAANLPLSRSAKVALLEERSTLRRLRMQLSNLGRMNRFVCVRCGNSVSTDSSILKMSGLGVSNVFVNPHGIISRLVITKEVRRSSAAPSFYAERPVLQDTWFDGYAWTIMNCAQCEAHIGWVYNWLPQGLKAAFALAEAATTYPAWSGFEWDEETCHFNATCTEQSIPPPEADTGLPVEAPSIPTPRIQWDMQTSSYLVRGRRLMPDSEGMILRELIAASSGSNTENSAYHVCFYPNMMFPQYAWIPLDRLQFLKGPPTCMPLQFYGLREGAVCGTATADDEEEEGIHRDDDDEDDDDDDEEEEEEEEEDDEEEDEALPLIGGDGEGKEEEEDVLDGID